MTSTVERPTVALLTAPTWPSLSPDDTTLVQAFERAGWHARPQQWRDPVQRDDLALIRSCWDYVEHHEDFLHQLRAWDATTTLLNPVETVTWNASKRYLLDLRDSGVTVPPTRIIEDDPSATLADAMTSLGVGDVVVKPMIGAGGGSTWRTRDPEDERWSLRGAAVVVQPFVPAILDAGEISLIWFGDGFSHAVLKRPTAGEFRIQTAYGGRVEAYLPPREVLDQAEMVLEVLPHRWAYARVDGIVTEGRFILMEVELVEPELFFRFAPNAAERFVATLLASGAP